MQLSPEQRAAVSAQESKVVVIAGPGAGKSRCLVERAKTCQNPGNTIICSFTNAAADELRNRLDNDGCNSSKFRYIGTLHSWAIIELSCNGLASTIMGDAEKEESIKDVTKTLGAKARNMSAAEIWRHALDIPAFGNGRSVGMAVRAWFKAKGGIHIDFVLPDFFDRLDMVVPPDELLIDEVQDSGETDAAIYNYFARRGSTLWEVGDLRQSIFGFRGARPDIMLADTKTAAVYQLRTNYRSVPMICAFGTRLGRAMTGMEHLDAEIVATKTGNTEDGGWTATRVYDSSEEEALDVAAWAEDVKGSCAILCRYRDQVHSVASILRAKGITLSASTDMELDTASEAWLPQLVAEADYWEVERMIDNDWTKAMTKCGIPFDTQRKLLPRLLHCHSAADIAGLAAEDAEPEPCQCFVGTIHSAKGREWDHVWVVGCDNATFHSNDQETLRLLFVAATRSRYSLTISYARSRIQPGSLRRITVEPSEFLKLL